MKHEKLTMVKDFVPRRGAAQISSMSVGDLAWLAGIVEGEGSIGYSKQPRRGVRSARLAIEMKDRLVVNHCGALMGTSIFFGHKKRGSYMTEAWGKRCLCILKLIMPSLVGEKLSCRKRLLQLRDQFLSNIQIIPLASVYELSDFHGGPGGI
jgi:hypothetical protein